MFLYVKFDVKTLMNTGKCSIKGHSLKPETDLNGMESMR